MLHLPEPLHPLVGLGMTSLVLGVIGLMLFFLPILGIPISGLGMAFALIGLLYAFYGGGPSLRWSLMGVGLCSLALLVNIALVYAPSGYTPRDRVHPEWNPSPDRPYVPPPAQG